MMENEQPTKMMFLLVVLGINVRQTVRKSPEDNLKSCTMLDQYTAIGYFSLGIVLVYVKLAVGSRKGRSIVIEGLDGVGKTDLSTVLASKLSAKLMRTPPNSMRSFRSFFDDHNDRSMGKAYYMVGNFVAGNEMEEDCNNGETVVMDRYYASTIAYELGMNDKELPPIGSIEYEWPKELYKPDHMILITMKEEDRLARRAGRKECAETKQEEEIRKAPWFAERINIAYQRLGCKEIHITKEETREEILQRVLDHIRLHN